MGLAASLCQRRRSSEDPIEGEADWLIINSTNSHSAFVPAARHLNYRNLWFQSIRRVLSVLAIKRAFVKLGLYLRSPVSHTRAHRRHVASSWSAIGKYLQKHKHIYRNNGP